MYVNVIVLREVFERPYIIIFTMFTSGERNDMREGVRKALNILFSILLFWSSLLP